MKKANHSKPKEKANRIVKKFKKTEIKKDVSPSPCETEYNSNIKKNETNYFTMRPINTNNEIRKQFDSEKNKYIERQTSDLIANNTKKINRNAIIGNTEDNAIGLHNKYFNTNTCSYNKINKPIHKNVKREKGDKKIITGDKEINSGFNNYTINNNKDIQIGSLDARLTRLEANFNIEKDTIQNVVKDVVKETIKDFFKDMIIFKDIFKIQSEISNQPTFKNLKITKNTNFQLERNELYNYSLQNQYKELCKTYKEENKKYKEENQTYKEENKKLKDDLLHKISIIQELSNEIKKGKVLKGSSYNSNIYPSYEQQQLALIDKESMESMNKKFEEFAKNLNDNQNPSFDT